MRLRVLLLALCLTATGCTGSDSPEPEGAAPPQNPPTATSGSTTAAASDSTTSSSQAPETTAVSSSPPEQWQRLPDAPVAPGIGASAVWSGTEMLVWAGIPFRGGPGAEPATPAPRDAGAAYDPATNRWRRLPRLPIEGRAFHVAVWTDREMILWGGETTGGLLADGAAYDPATNRWRPLAAAPLAPRCCLDGVWTGTEMLVFSGGNEGMGYHTDGAAYDPATDRWRTLAAPQRPPGVGYLASKVWTGREMLVASHVNTKYRWAAYDPSRDSWRAVAPILPPIENYSPRTVWTGRELLSWGPTHECLYGDCFGGITGVVGLRLTGGG